MRRRLAVLAMAPLTALIGLAPAQAQPGLPAGVTCSQTSTASPIICSGKIPSWDGVPLDADLTIPPGPVKPRPLIVMLHGYANQKTEWESTSAGNSNPDKDHYNNFWFASQGYAVLTYTARGFHGSCGQGPLQGPRCARGWMHLADPRFEGRATPAPSRCPWWPPCRSIPGATWSTRSSPTVVPPTASCYPTATG